MIRRMKLAPMARKLVLALACLLPLAAAPGGAMAQDVVEVEHDGRLEGYSEPMAMEGGSQALTWIGFALLAAVSLLALFKDAKRSHLD